MARPKQKMCPKCDRRRPKVEGQGYCRPCRAIANREQHYKMTSDQFWARVAAQDGVCPICDKALSVKSHVDHCGERDLVRGILCAGCNTALGKLKHSPEHLERAAAYLQGDLTDFSQINRAA